MEDALLESSFKHKMDNKAPETAKIVLPRSNYQPDSLL